MFFHLLYLISFLKFNKCKKNIWCIVGFLALAAMMASTPKGILFFVTDFSFIMMFTLSSKKYDQTFKFIALTIMPLVIGGAILLLILSDVFLAAHTYFINSFSEGFSKPSYLSEKSFYFVFRFLQENPLIMVSLLLFGLLSLRMKEVRNKTPEEKAIIMVFFLSLGFVIFHNDRLPFYINVMMIIPIAASSWLISDILDHLSKKNKMKKIYIIALLIMFAKGGYYTERNLNRNSNADQIQSIKYLEDYLSKYPGVTYYDGMGAMPRSNTIYHFITPTLADNLKNTLETLEREKPDLIFFSNRMFYFMKPILDQLKASSYFYLGDGVYGKYESLENLKGATLYKYQGPFFLKLKPVDGDFSSSAKMKVYSRFAPVELPPEVPFFQVFDFDPRF